jgi:hypothetical protein
MPVRHVVVPLPVIDWTTVLKADNPTREATRGRLRELRKKRQVTGGVTVLRRGRRGLEGRATYHSVLSALAAKSRQEGHDEDAARLEKGASALEEQFAARLEQFLSQHNLTQLPEADFFYELTTATAQRIAEWSHLPQALLAAARVEAIEGAVAHLEGSSPQGGAVAVDLPRALLDRQSLTTGDVVWVFSRVVGDAALVDLLPAIRVQIFLEFPLHGSSGLNALFDVAPVMDGLNDEPDGLTDAERAEYAAHFSATVGADLTAEEAADLRGDAAAGRVTRRRLRPAG